MPLDDLDSRKAESQPGEDVGTELARLRRNLDQIPHHAGSAPTVNVADPDDKPVVAPSQGNDGIPLDSDELVGLRGRIHYLQAIQAGCDQLGQAAPVVAP